MANYCDYVYTVVGARNACYAMLGSTPGYDDAPQIAYEAGTEELTFMRFYGSCKWNVDAYCDNEWDKKELPELPSDCEAARALAEEKYMYYTVEDRSRMFQVDVWVSYEEESGEAGGMQYNRGDCDYDADDLPAIAYWHNEQPEQMEIVDGKLESCISSKTTIVIPDHVTEIAEYAFEGCIFTQKIIVPDSVKIIGDCAFSNCRYLIEANIPESVTTIGEDIFCGCIHLKQDNAK